MRCCAGRAVVLSGSVDRAGSGPSATKGDEMKFFKEYIIPFIVSLLFWFIIIYFVLRAVE